MDDARAMNVGARKVAKLIIIEVLRGGIIIVMGIPSHQRGKQDGTPTSTFVSYAIRVGMAEKQDM